MFNTKNQKGRRNKTPPPISSKPQWKGGGYTKGSKLQKTGNRNKPSPFPLFQKTKGPKENMRRDNEGRRVKEQTRRRHTRTRYAVPSKGQSRGCTGVSDLSLSLGRSYRARDVGGRRITLDAVRRNGNALKRGSSPQTHPPMRYPSLLYCERELKTFRFTDSPESQTMSIQVQGLCTFFLLFFGQESQHNSQNEATQKMDGKGGNKTLVSTEV